MNVSYQIENESSDEERRKNRRRSKNDNDGRTYKCDICGKAYLSYPALYTHVKTKHDLQGNKANKGRGRPKKENGNISNTSRLLYNPLSFDYFKHPDRCGETYESSLNMIFQMVFNEVFTNIRGKNEETTKRISNYVSIGDYPLFSKIHDCYNSIFNIDENSKCDEIFAYYLFKVGKCTNEDFFQVVLKFVLLYRECLNYCYKDTVSNKYSLTPNHPEYSEVFTAEDAPDISNEFILDFLQTEAIILEFSKEDSIDLTQNLCQWLYDNNYTCSKLSLINNS